MDHLVPPLADDQPMFEAIVTTTWLAAHTERLRVGSLVLCDAFRHPAVLARQAVSIDHASGGRFELGIGWGSVREEFTTFGVGSIEPRERVDRLRETLEVVRALWAGEVVDYDGSYHQLHNARQEPRPVGGRIPIVIGGIGPKTLALVREFADWWNVHVGQLNKIEELRPQVGDARASIQQTVALIGRDRRSRRRHRARDASLRLVPAGHRHRARAGRLLRDAGASAGSSASTRGSATSRRRKRSPNSART